MEAPSEYYATCSFHLKMFHVGQGTATPLYCFCIVGKCDTPLYERDLSPPGRRDDTPHLDEFIMHAALDVVDELAWQGTNL